jgi:5'-nucleotidase/UDP-sugar diphosphatase
MVAVLNAMGLDFATFGNHEFDLDEDAFRARLTESRFRWLSANVASSSAAPLPGVASHVILRLAGAAGDTLRLALFGATMDRDTADFVRIDPPFDAATRIAAILADSADATVAITHLPWAQDQALAEAAPSIDLIIGGHDHDNLLIHRGERSIPIAKADANALSVYVHELTWTPSTGAVRVRSTLVPITDSLADDAPTAAVAGEWVERAYAGFRDSGFEPGRVIARTPIPLDGLESSILSDTTSLTRLISRAMLAEAGDARVAIYNAGSIRIDDVLPPGPVTEYDVIRILPFGGSIVDVEMTGALLLRILEQGRRNIGTGGFLQFGGITAGGDGGFRVAGATLDAGSRYRVAVSDFLLSGREQGLAWLDRDHPEIRVVRELRDVRQALIDEFARSFPAR